MSTEIISNYAPVAGDYVDAYYCLQCEVNRFLNGLYIDAKIVSDAFDAVSHLLPKREGEHMPSGSHDGDMIVSIAPEYLISNIDIVDDVDFHNYALYSLSVFISAFNEISYEKIPYKVDLASGDSSKNEYTRLAMGVNEWFYRKNIFNSFVCLVVNDFIKDTRYRRLGEQLEYTNGFFYVAQGYLSGSEDDLAFCEESYINLYSLATRLAYFSCAKSLSKAIETLKF